MAPPLLPITRLVVCSSCAEHVKSSDETCPHCGAVVATRQGLLARAAGVALAGVMLASCNGGKGGTDSQSGTSTGGDTEADTDTDGASTGTSSGSETTAGSESLSDTAQPAYGVPTSDFTTETTSGTTVDPSSSGSSGETDPGTSSMTGGPEYGVPDTSGGPEPDYGVPGTTGA